MKFRRIVLLTIILQLAACDQSSTTDNNSSVSRADVIYHNAKVYTVNDAAPWAEAVAIKGDEIVFVGSDHDAIELAGDDTVLTDLQGQMLLPGFIDSHAHPVAGGAYALALALDTFARPEDWVQAIAAYADANKDLPVIFGYGFLASAFENDGPAKSMIDAVVSDRPVLIMDEGFHGAWANSQLLSKLGINRETTDPVPGFSYYKRDSEGNPTGYLLEGTATRAMTDLDVITEESVLKGTAMVMEQMNRYGITAVFDAGAMDEAEFQLDVLKTLEDDGKLNLRYVGSLVVDNPEQMAATLERVQKLRKTNPYISTLKIMDDGTVEGKTAAMFVDYQDDPGNKGETVFTPEQMQWMISEAASINMDVHIHALGERAINDAFNK